ncbi:hypothetical protein IG631_08693 [Alternaria alternata]|nr:hypothetical protein IG631_08693 [Alternaria alternata]
MASEAVASSATEGLTPAQKLMQEHADHHVTVEDVPDEDELAHAPASDTAAPLSEKAAGKQKADDAPAAPKKPALNTQSEEAFPALGPVKPRAQASVAPTWGKKPAAVTSNGVNGSATAQSAPTRGPALPSMNIPGKHTERISLAAHQVAPRGELKKPINEIVRDINRRSKAKLDYKQGQGALIFEATGPVEAVRQALKEVANEVGSKVSHLCISMELKLTTTSNPSMSPSLPPFVPTSSVVKVPRSRKSASAPAPAFRSPRPSRARMRILWSMFTLRAMP